ncbi:sigma factor [Macrococcus lamae]|uniref:Sigma-70 family RNA polymerase sigma factor n=1 Tax=Macrococcus lamae TaxID=198484 RepID=A0A4R6BVM6_9STAP|nr:sigma factor [Macrococcus lamae]TDM12420.1 sigma-70 family RNA polymerase sigma factor [Macrococcus lamae]
MFEEWKVKYERMIYHILHHYQIKYDFDEYYQLALIKLWQIGETYDPAKCTNKDQFVYLKLKFFIIDEMRKRIKYQQRHQIVADDVLIPLMDCEDNTYAELFLEGVTDDLNDEERLWFNYAVIGYKINEIAEFTGNSPSTIKRWRRRAREKICKNYNFTFKSGL